MNKKSTAAKTASPEQSADPAITLNTETDPWTFIPDEKFIINPKTNAATPTPALVTLEDDASSTKTDSDIQLAASPNAPKVEYNEPSHCTDVSTDDCSDEISVISESDGGETGPKNKALSECFEQLNLRFIASKEFKQFLLDSESARPSSPDISPAASVDKIPPSPPEPEAPQPQPARQPMALLVVPRKRRNRDIVARSAQPESFMRLALRYLFYLAMLVAALIVLGSLHQHITEPNDKPVKSLKQRVADLEAHANLMRDELVLLADKVEFLKDLGSDGVTRSGVKWPAEKDTAGRRDKRKSFKAWPGVGESIDPVDITKEDLRRAHECGANFVEIAEMCVENTPNNQPLLKYLEAVVKDAWDESTLNKIVAAAVKGANKVKPPPEPKWKPLKEAPEAPEAPERETPQPKPVVATTQTEEEAKAEEACPKENHRFQSKEKSAEPREDSIDNENDRRNSKSEKAQRPKRSYRQDTSRSHEHDDGDDSGSKECGNGQKGKLNSRERYNKDSRNSRERGNKKCQSGERKERDGEWHERMMKQRAKVRRQNENKRNEKNWYIERGDGREHLRYGEAN